MHDAKVKREKKKKNIKAETDTTSMAFFEAVVYFGRPKKPSSGTMRILHWDVFLCSIL